MKKRSVTSSVCGPICGPVVGAVTERVAGATALQLLESWQPPSDTTAYLWRSYDTNVDTMEMWARSDNAGHFTIAQFKTYAITNGAILRTIGKLREGAVGTTVHHSSGAVTKTGTWANSANTGAFSGSSSQSSTAGNTIACSVTGSTLGLRAVCITNGGYATVAIDGDYTAADELPMVTQALIDAGKFQQAQLGHRYLNCYVNTSSTDFWDYHVLLTEKASNTAHVITVKAAGTAEGGTGNRTYITAFVGCTMAQSPGDAGTAMFHVRDVTNSDNGQLSAMTLAWKIAPTGYDPVDSGENHGNETLVSSTWAVDGVATTPSLNQIVSGSEITFSRVITTTHPVAGNVANKTDVFSCRGDRKYQVQYDWSTTFILSGVIGFAYCGMLNHYMNYAPVGDKFSAYVVGNGAIGRLTGSDAQNGKLKTTVAGFLDPSHDTIGTVTVPDPATSLNNWTYSVFFVWASDIAANRKIYFTRALGSGTFEPVVADQVLHGSCAWRTFRLADGYDRLSALIP